MRSTALTLVCLVLSLAAPVSRALPQTLADLTTAESFEDGPGWSSLAASVRRRQQQALDEKFAADPSAFLCPGRNVACPLSGSVLPPPRVDAWNAVGYECVDPSQELGNCGGCARTGNGTDCASVHGTYGATCVNGVCMIRQCKPGYTFDPSGKCVRPSGYTRSAPILSGLPPRHHHE